MKCTALPGSVCVERISVRKRDGLILPETGGMRAWRVGRVDNGVVNGEDLSGKYVFYLTHTEVRGVHRGRPFVLVPSDAVMAEAVLEEDEIAEPLVLVDADTGVDAGWYGG